MQHPIRRKPKAWLQLKVYHPPQLRIGAPTRLGGRMTQAHLVFDDHPPRQRFADRIQTVTADSALHGLAHVADQQSPAPHPNSTYPSRIRTGRPTS